MPTNKIINTDGWMNLFTGQGTVLDRKEHTNFDHSKRFSAYELDQLYRGDGLARRIIDIPVQEMTRRWITVEGDTGGEILDALEALHARKNIALSMKWAKLYGGAVTVMGIDDGQTLDMPVKENSIKAVRFLRVYDRFQVTPDLNNLEPDPMSPLYGLPVMYKINPLNGTTYDVHVSRLLLFDGEDVPDRARLENQGWGDPLMVSVFETLRSFGIGYSATVNILSDFVQAVMTVQDLQSLLTTDEGTELVKKRLEIMGLSRSVLGILLLDENETFEKKASSVAGLADLLDRFQVMLSAITGIPVTKLFGKSPAGLNATGESDIRNFYDELSGEQEDKLRNPLETLIRYVMLSKEGPTGGRVVKEYRLVFNSLWQSDDSELAEVREKIARADALYIDRGVLEPEEVAISRFGGDTYSLDTTIDISVRERLLKKILTMMETERLNPPEPVPVQGQGESEGEDPPSRGKGEKE